MGWDRQGWEETAEDEGGLAEQNGLGKGGLGNVCERGGVGQSTAGATCSYAGLRSSAFTVAWSAYQLEGRQPAGRQAGGRGGDEEEEGEEGEEEHQQQQAGGGGGGPGATWMRSRCDLDES